MGELLFSLLLVTYFASLVFTLYKIIVECRLSFVAKGAWITAVLFTPFAGMLLFNLSFTNTTTSSTIHNKILIASLITFLLLVVLLMLFQFVFVP
jgi:hypothetical protein